MIRVKTITATYAVSHRNVVGRSIEIAKGIVTGSAPDVNRVRELSEEDVASCESFPFWSIYVHIINALTRKLTFDRPNSQETLHRKQVSVDGSDCISK